MEELISEAPASSLIEQALFDSMSEEETDCFVEKSLKSFWEQGYMVLPHAIDSTIICDTMHQVIAADSNLPDSLRPKASLEFERIILEVNKTFIDNRLQAPLPKKFINLKHGISKVVKRFHMRWQTKQWVVLKSLPGGQEQDPHHDFCQFDISKARKKYPKTIQAGLIVGLMPKTKLVVYPKCFSEADPCKRTEVEFGPGDCIIFRGDLVHCGTSFDVVNYRIHCMLPIKGISWQQYSTELALPPSFKCDFCSFMAPTSSKIRDHRKYCLNNPNHNSIAARYQDRNNQGKTSVVCNKFYSKRNSFYRHWGRRHKQARITALQ
ncbi:unnamed protein product [Phytophthora fragariaefolia]|uniref:Unnamed protein product n=1 Tax=Phytophthora fragariaefolia TaxID=1490495 RepID=A0A9W6U669_9STRA|nr:unnamed protein product [Phytophthora fragariaefolia]